MNRAEAIKALIAGKKVERVYKGGGLRLRWHEEHGIQIENIVTHSLAGRWLSESGDTYNTYREVFEPRVFLDVWEEVQTFEEAERATKIGNERFGIYESRIAEEAVEPWTSGTTEIIWVKRKAGK